MTDRPAFVLLEDGAWFPGTTARPLDPAFGEVVFTTNLTGYQETFTDPSYLGQIVVMTAPMIGNYGINTDDMESGRPQVSGVVVRELSRHPSNWRSTRSLDAWLSEAGVPVLEGIDTRRLTRHLRERGAMRGVVAEGRQPSRELTAQLLASPSMEGLDLASRATVREPYSEGAGPHVVAYDYGIKRNIVRMLVAAGCRVTVVPAETSAAEVRALNPDGLFLSNGPGDPAAVDYALTTVRNLAGSGLPTFGICLGHQLVGLAFGGSTAKLPYGHRGRQSSGARSPGRTGPHHDAKPWLRGGWRCDWGARRARPGGDPSQPQRRNDRGRSPSGAATVRGAISSRGGPRTARRVSALRGVHGLAAAAQPGLGPTTP